MQPDQIVSLRVRRLITGSCTPASDILALDNLTQFERAEAHAYFSYAGGLLSAAAVESDYVRSHDV